MLASRTQGGGLLSGMSFFAPLGTSLVPVSSAGSSTPTYTRATTATFTDWENIVRPALSGEARFQGARRVRNYFSNSQQPLNAVGGATDTGGIADPNGGTAARQISFGASGRYFADGVPVGPAGTLTGFSIWVQFVSGTSSGNLYVKDTATDTVRGQAAVTATASWQRVFVSGTIQTTNGRLELGGANGSGVVNSIWNVAFGMAENLTGQSNTNPGEYVSVGVLSAPYQGANVDGVQYFQNQNGNTVSNNVVTAGTGAAIGSTTLLGYLAEGARTNICLQSEDFSTSWTVAASTVATNQTAAPDGNSTADKLQEDNTTAVHRVQQTATTMASGTQYTLSVFVKSAERSIVALNIANYASAIAWFNLSNGTVGTVQANVTATIKAYPNGWYRCTITGTPNVANALFDLFPSTTDNVSSYAGTTGSGVYLWGADIEAASFASSYIPTTSASVTRNADLLSYPSAGNAIIGAGTIYSEASAPAAAATSSVSINDGTTNNRSTLLVSASNGGRMVVSSGAVTQADVSIGNGTINVAAKIAGVWNTNIGNAYFNSTSGTLDTNVTVPASFTQIEIGAQASVSGFVTVRNVRIWTIQLTDTQLQGITT